MDSENSASLQSSSGDDEHDSRPADSISALMNNSNKRRAIHGGIQANPNPLSNPLQQVNSANFDLLSNYFDAISRPPPHPQSSLLNLDMSWSKTLRSDLNSSSADHHHIDQAMISSSSNIQPFFGSFTTATATATNPPGTENNSATNTPRPASEQSNPAHVVRNPKKRSRASRRAPTTVLTTDTTNFRAMVQEFTGIPAPPFTSSPFSRNSPRLDLYGTAPSSLRSNPLDSSQPTSSYLRRPFPQKVAVPVPPPSLPFLASSSSASSSPLLNSTSMVDLDHHTNRIGSTSTPGAAAAAAAAAALNFQVQLPTQTSATNLFNNLPNHLILSSALFQSSKFPPSHPPPDIGLDIPSSKESPLKVGGIILDQFGHVNASSLGGLPGLIPSDQTTSRNNDTNNPGNWGGNGNLSISRMSAATNGKMNFSSSTNPSGFHGEKGTDNVAVTAASRGEGMVESWICSSD